MYFLMSSLVKIMLGGAKYRPVALKDWTTVNSVDKQLVQTSGRGLFKKIVISYRSSKKLSSTKI